MPNWSKTYLNHRFPYGRLAEVILSRGQKQGDKSSPLLFGLVFNALLLAFKATRVGHCPSFSETHKKVCD
jgi:hypothetical protein